MTDPSICFSQNKPKGNEVITPKRAKVSFENIGLVFKDFLGF